MGDGGENVVPAVDAGVGGVGAVVWSVEEEAGAAHALKVGGCVVEEVVDVEDELFAAENDALDGNLGDVAGDPVDFVAEGIGEFEGGAGDVDAMLVAELAHYFERAGHGGQSGECAGLVEHTEDPGAVFVGDDVGEFGAVHVVGDDVGSEVEVVVVEHFAQGIDEHLIHIDGDAELAVLFTVPVQIRGPRGWETGKGCRG